MLASSLPDRDLQDLLMNPAYDGKVCQGPSCLAARFSPAMLSVAFSSIPPVHFLSLTSSRLLGRSDGAHCNAQP